MTKKMTFLNETARYIFSKHKVNDLQNICVVLPTRRAVYYFKRALAQQASVPFLAPEVLAVDDFFLKFSGKKLVDPVDLLFKLFDIFKEIDPKVELDKFATWAPTLLKDFDTIDLYLISPKEIFAYMSEARMLEKWNLDYLEANKPAIEKTERMDKFFKLFENLLTVYNNLHNLLIINNLAYRGMAYREVAENIKDLILKDNLYEKYYFLGFNALSASEEKVIETLVKTHRAETLWDSDEYYMKGRNKAGDFLREYRQTLKFGKWNWLNDDLLTSKKELKIIGVQNNTLQAKVAGHLYTEMLKAEAPTETAIVLADENMLLPIMYSLDEQITDFNITMGLSLRNSMLFSFVDSIFELQQNIVEFKGKSGNKIKIPKYSHRHIAKVLNHPFVRRYELIYEPKDKKEQFNSPIRQILYEITSKNLVFLSETEILDLGAKEPLIEVLFRRWGDEPMKSLKCFYDIVEVLRSIYDETQDAIELEYLYLFYTILNRLESILKNRSDVKLRSFKTFLYEFIKQTKIPFSGEPIAQLQIMGMLETRCLDFERIIILSVNEGNLPSGKKTNSLIPFDACMEMGLPVYSQQDSVMAYHFFRLLQRAKQVDILYVLPTNDGLGGGGEKSRFIQQLEYELAKMNPKIKITKPNIQITQELDNQAITTDLSKIEITKTKEIIQKLQYKLAEEGVYPSHLSQYVRCNLQYYFTQIARVSQREEIDEKLGTDVFGNWIHKTLEIIDKDYATSGKEMTDDDAKQIIQEIPARLQAVYEADFKGYVVDSGMNFLLSKVAEKLLIDFFKIQIETKVFPLKVLSVEKTLSVFFETPILGKVQKIKIAGRVDRIELKDTILSVVDYKTGKVEKKDLELDKDQTWQEALLEDSDKEKLRQLWLYQYLMLKKMTSENGIELGGKRLNSNDYVVKTKIYSFRNMKENLEKNIQLTDNQDISFNKNANESFIEESENLLRSFANELLNPALPFVQTNDEDICQYCDFKGICGK